MSTTTTDAAWATAVIAYWSDVDLREVYPEPDTLTFGDDIVEITQVHVTATTTRDARRLAELLDLSPEAADPAVMWQAWTGWICEASAQQPVTVRVTAPTNELQES